MWEIEWRMPRSGISGLSVHLAVNFFCDINGQRRFDWAFVSDDCETWQASEIHFFFTLYAQVSFPAVPIETHETLNLQWSRFREFAKSSDGHPMRVAPWDSGKAAEYLDCLRRSDSNSCRKFGIFDSRKRAECPWADTNFDPPSESEPNRNEGWLNVKKCPKESNKWTKVDSKRYANTLASKRWRNVGSDSLNIHSRHNDKDIRGRISSDLRSQTK
jgi:hypothetical protein